MKYTLNSFLTSILTVFFIYSLSFNALSNSYYASVSVPPDFADAYGSSAVSACMALPTYSGEEVTIDNEPGGWRCMEVKYDPIGSVCKLVDLNTTTPSAYYEVIEGGQLDLPFFSTPLVYGDCGQLYVRILGLKYSDLNIISGSFTDQVSSYLIESPQTLKVSSIQNNYFSGDQTILLTYEGYEFTVPPVQNVLTNLSTTINLVDDDPVPVISFTGLNEITEGEIIDLTISLDTVIDEGFSLQLSLNDASVLTSQGAYIAGHGYFTSVTNAPISSDKVSLSQLSLTANSLNDEKNLGSKE